MNVKMVTNWLMFASNPFKINLSSGLTDDLFQAKNHRKTMMGSQLMQFNLERLGFCWLGVGGNQGRKNIPSFSILKAHGMDSEAWWLVMVDVFLVWSFLSLEKGGMGVFIIPLDTNQPVWWWWWWWWCAQILKWALLCCWIGKLNDPCTVLGFVFCLGGDVLRRIYGMHHPLGCHVLL